jgi:hypothetical protein
MLSMLVVMAGCQTGASGPSGTTGPTVAATSAPLPPTGAELEAIRFRQEFGLRADIAYVRSVAADPSASSAAFSVPLLPTEVADLQGRSTNADAVRDIVAAEAAAHPEDYCGRYIDNQNGGAFTSMWRANRAIHAAAILLKIGPLARIAFVDCLFTEAEVTRVCDLLNLADHGWMDEIPAKPLGWGCGNADDRVNMDISSAVPDAAARVLAHYTELFDLPPGILHVESDGTGQALIPWGAILIQVLKPDGTLIGPNDLSFSWAADEEGPTCGGGDVGYGPSWSDEPANLPCQEGRWTISVTGLGVGAAVYGSGTVSIHGGESAKLTIRLTRDPPAAG